MESLSQRKWGRSGLSRTTCCHISLLNKELPLWKYQQQAIRKISNCLPGKCTFSKSLVLKVLHGWHDQNLARNESTIKCRYFVLHFKVQFKVLSFMHTGKLLLLNRMSWPWITETVVNLFFRNTKQNKYFGSYYRLCPYFNGRHHLEEIMYYENVRRSELLTLLDKFRRVLMTCEHEDPGTSCWSSGS